MEEVGELTAVASSFSPPQSSNHSQSHLLFLLHSPQVLTPWCFVLFAI